MNKVQDSIILKLLDQPFRYNQTNVLTQTNRSIFPFNDWFRGEYLSEIPIVAEREAGFRPIVSLPPSTQGLVTPYPQHCFRVGVKTKYPCYPECIHAHKRSDVTLQRFGKVFLYS
jgi:hypothetical protein